MKVCVGVNFSFFRVVSRLNFFLKKETKRKAKPPILRLRQAWNFVYSFQQIAETSSHFRLLNFTIPSTVPIEPEIKLTRFYLKTLEGCKPQLCDCHCVRTAGDLRLELKGLCWQHFIISGKRLFLPLVLIIITLIGVKGNPFCMLNHRSSLKRLAGEMMCCLPKYGAFREFGNTVCLRAWQQRLYFSIASVTTQS